MEEKAMRVPSALIAGCRLKLLVVLVSWMKRPVVVSTTKISAVPSALPGFPGARFEADSKAIRVPSALIEGAKLPPGLLVIWVKRLVVVSKTKISLLPSALPGFPGVRSRLEEKAMRVPAALIDG
jgi:hypothetical protein